MIDYRESPSVNDIVSFDLATYDDFGLLKVPCSFEKITIYHIEKGSENRRFIDHKIYQPHIESLFDEASIGDNNVLAADLKMILEKTATTNRFYYTNAKIVMDTKSPLWTSDNKVKILFPIKQKNEDTGRFRFLWKPEGMREGTYIIKWEWKVNGESKFCERLFNLTADLSKIDSIYSKLPPREKYNFLMDKYIPKVYRTQTKPNDITPQVLTAFNKSVAQSLLELEDLAVQVGDLLDPIFTHEYFLPLLANFFNLELRSNNVGAWRNQIKHALNLYKKKGTVEGLQEALDQIGIRLLGIKNLWQVASRYKWVDSFVIDKDINDAAVIGYLSKIAIDGKISVAICSADGRYVELPENILILRPVNNPELKISVIWNGGILEQPINLFKGDLLKITYQYNKMPDSAKTTENYIANLPLADMRKSDVKYPLKNWNIKLIETDDPLFDVLIPERNPFYNPVTFGKIRTTFLYSEKVYNMDTYNGSLFNSVNPCDMDKDFIDACVGGQSSKFNIYIEMDGISDSKIKEVNNVIADYAPFHSIVHGFKINVKINDLILPPVENIQSKVKDKNNSKKDERVQTGEAIYCVIKNRDGSVLEGRVI